MKMVLKDGKRKVLTLSYDDGVVQDKRFIEILGKHGLKCTFNINSGLYDKEGAKPSRFRMLRSDAIKLYTNSPHEVAVHSYTHAFLEKLDSTEVIYEIMEDRKAIERDYGVVARGMAYPYGTYSDEVVNILEKCGIVYARTVENTNSFNFPKNWLKLHPTCHHNAKNLMELAKNFVEKDGHSGNSQMFYLWGHTFEFDRHDNWNVIEEFAEFVGGRDDIWYATNIEIYDYVTAYNRLQTSYDKSIITNPSAIDVWVEVKGETLCIKAGESVKI